MTTFRRQKNRKKSFKPIFVTSRDRVKKANPQTTQLNFSSGKYVTLLRLGDFPATLCWLIRAKGII
jgi:hypothetical protein